MSSRKQNIVIVGGGAAAASVAKGLSDALDASRYSVQIVTERPYHIHYPAMLRVVTTSKWPEGDKAFVPWDRLFTAGKAGEVVIGKVTSVTDSSVQLEDGQSIAYDYLVLATGTTWNGPLVFPSDPKERDKWVAEWRSRFSKAQDVVIIGGGANGIELAGELKHWYPNQNVTIVHSEAALLNSFYTDKFRKYATQRVRDIGVNVILGDRASIPSTQPYTSVTTEKGKTIKADLVVPMWGANYNTGFLKSFDSSIISSKGQVKVNPHLQVQLSSGKANVFALGDIAEWPEATQLAKVPAQAKIVIDNIIAQTQGKAPAADYKGGMEAIAVPLGPQKGFGYIPLLWGVTLGDWSTRMLKSKELFVSKALQMMNY